MHIAGNFEGCIFRELAYHMDSIFNPHIICVIYSFGSSLPSTIDPAVAISALRSRRTYLIRLFRHCLPSLSNSLLSESIIPREVCEQACNQTLGSTERVGSLLDSVESRVEVVPSDFTTFVHILESERYLESLAEGLVNAYSKLW